MNYDNYNRINHVIYYLLVNIINKIKTYNKLT